MIFMGPTDYYFWQGVKAGFEKLNPKLVLGQNSQVAKDSELSYQDGHSIGSELTARDFNLLTKPKIRLKVKKPTEANVGPKNNALKKIAEVDKEIDEFDDEFNTNLRGNC